jgi:protein-tyrosine phosphatase
MAAGLLDAHLRSLGTAAAVRSAGTDITLLPVSPEAVAAMGEWGVDISRHVPRPLTAGMVAEEGTDLVLGMAREHLRRVVLLDRSAWSRTFTVKELVRRGGRAGRRRDDEPLDAWLERVGEGRSPRDLLGDDEADDVPDPYGRPLQAHRRVAAEFDGLVVELLALLRP